MIPGIIESLSTVQLHLLVEALGVTWSPLLLIADSRRTRQALWNGPPVDGSNVGRVFLAGFYCLMDWITPAESEKKVGAALVRM